MSMFSPNPETVSVPWCGISTPARTGSQGSDARYHVRPVTVMRRSQIT